MRTLQHAIPLEERVRFLLLTAWLERDLTLRQVAKLAGMNAEHCRRVIMGKRPVTLRFMAFWFSALEVDFQFSVAPKEGVREEEPDYTLEGYLEERGFDSDPMPV